MRKLTKKISMLMVLAMLVGLFSGVVSASAASKWSFKSADGDWDVAVGATINLDQDKYENFDLYKSGVLADEATYTITWESSDEKAVWVNAKSGQLRAKKDAADGAEAVITANIVNNTNKATHKVSFTIVVGEVKVPDYKIQVENLTVELGAEVKFAPVVMLGEEVVKFATHKCYNGYFIGEEAIANPFTFDVAGEYTVTVGHFASKAEVADLTKAIRTEDFTVTVKPDKADIVDVSQKDLDTILVVFNDEAFAKKAADAAAADIEKTFELTFNADKVDAKGGDRVDHELYKVDSVNGNVVEISAYKPLEENYTYKLAYLEDGKEVDCDWVIGSGKIPASIEIVKNDKVVVETETEMKWIVKNNKDVEITAWYDRDLYPVEWKIVDEDDMNSFVDVNAGTIYFFEKNKTTKVGLVLDMGYDDNGEIKDLEAVGTFTSVDNTATEKPNAYAIVAPGTDETANNITWTDTFNLYVGEGQNNVLELYAKYTKKAADGKTSTKYIVEGLNTDDGAEYTYQSSNTDIVAIDENDGHVYPVAVGSARLFIKKDGIVIGAANVIVHKEVVFQTFEVNADKTFFSVIGDGYKIDEQKIGLTATLKDKLGRAISLDDVAIRWELLSPSKIISIDGLKTEFELDDVFETPVFTVVNGANAAVIKADQGGPLAVGAGEVLVKEKAVKSFRVKFTATYTDPDTNKETKLYDYLTFNVKNTTGVDSVITDLKVPTLNTYLGVVDKLSVENYKGKIEAVQTDSQGYYIDTVAIDEVLYDPTEEVAVTEGYVTLVISKDSKALDPAKAPKFAENAYDVTVSPVWADGSELKKAEVGNYKVQLFEGTGEKARRIKFANMIVKNEGNAYSVLKVKEWITSYADIENLDGAVEFRLGDGKIELTDDIVTAVVPNIDYNRTDTNRVYIYSFDLQICVDELIKKLSNGGKAWENTTDYFVETVVFNKTFTIK